MEKGVEGKEERIGEWSLASLRFDVYACIQYPCSMDACQDAQLTLVPVRRRKLHHQVCDQLREYLPELDPGTQLQETDLAKRIGVSRTPIREALVRLAAEGLVEILPNARYRVQVLKAKDIEDLYDLRIALECKTAETLAPRITDDQVRELQQLAVRADQMETLREDRRAYDDAEQTFHVRFVEMGGNRWIQQILNRQHVLDRCLKIPVDDWREMIVENLNPRHEELVDLLALRDPRRAAAGFRAHIVGRKGWLLSRLEGLAPARTAP